MGKSGVVEIMKKIIMPAKDVIEPSNIYYSNIAVRYVFRKRIDLALKLAGDVKNKKVLDVGSGDGFLSLNLAIRGAKVFACDIVHRNTFEKVNIILTGRKINFNVADVNYLPYRSQLFDIVFALDMLEHLQSSNQALLEIKRVLTDNGSLIVSIPTDNIFYTFGRKIAMIKRRGYTHETTAQELINLLSQNFKEIYHKNIPPLFNLFLIKKFRKSKPKGINTCVISQGGKI